MNRPERPNHDYPTDPLDRDFEMYEDYFLGILDEIPPVPPNLDHDQREILYRKRAFLEWKYEDGLEEAQTRHPEGYRYIEQIRSLPEIEENDDESNFNWE
jgi:hypothetical protein